MEIHRYEKFWFGASLLLIIGFIAIVTYGSIGAGVEMVDDRGGTVDPDNLGDHERFGNTGLYQVNETHYELNMIALHPNFIPQEVTVPEGSTVRFFITSNDVIHSYDIVGTNVNTMVIPGQIAEFTVEFEEVGEYGVVCSEFCGNQHHTMEGKFNVVSEDEWDEDMIDGDAADIGGDA